MTLFAMFGCGRKRSFRGRQKEGGGMQQTGLTKGQPALRNDAANSGRVYRLSSLSMRFRMPYGVAKQAHAADAGWRVYDADARAGM